MISFASDSLLRKFLYTTLMRLDGAVRGLIVVRVKNLGLQAIYTDIVVLGLCVITWSQ